MRLMIAIAVLALGAFQPAFASDRAPPLCPSYRALVDLVRETGLTQRIRLWKSAALSLDMAVACMPGGVGNPAGNFCRAAVGATSLEFYHNYPYQLLDCVRALDPNLKVTKAGGYTGLSDREKIVHLTASAGDGLRVDLVFRPDQGQTKDGFGEYFGVYELVIWKAD